MTHFTCFFENGKLILAQSLTYFKDLELHTIELKKFMDAVSNKVADVVAKIKTSLDIWVAFLTKYNLFDKDNLPKNLENSGLKKALTVLEVMNFSEDEREGYEDHLKWLRIQTNTIKKYEQNARIEGEARGEARGEGLATHRIAKSMLACGIDVDIVMKSTGLRREEVEKIKETI